MARQETVETLEARLVWERRLVQLIDRIHAAKSLDAIFLELQSQILALLDAERMTLYAVDAERNELYSKFLALDAVKESSCAGTARATSPSSASPWGAIFGSIAPRVA